MIVVVIRAPNGRPALETIAGLRIIA